MAFRWDRLTRMRVCFGHQSVGADIVKALSMLTQQRLEVIETDDPKAYQRPMFGHFRVGNNGDPLSKCRAFARVIQSGVGDLADVALFKFCYVDITYKIDVEALFREYREMMATLSGNYPKLTFVHVTVPLRMVSRGVRGWLCEWSGRFDQAREDQVRRHAFNELLRKCYAGTGCLFDLAEVEATFPDGAPSSFSHRGQPVPRLVPQYTKDGGHLNQQAAERAARQLLACLSSAPTDSRKPREGQGY